MYVSRPDSRIVLTAPNQTGSAFISHLPNRVCDGRSGQLSGNIRNNGFLWFDTALLSRCRRSDISAIAVQRCSTVPGINNWDLGVEKSFLLRARINKTPVPRRNVQCLESRPVPAPQRGFRRRRELRPDLGHPPTAGDPNRPEAALVEQAHSCAHCGHRSINRHPKGPGSQPPRW